MDPRAWLDDYESRIADLQRKSVDLQENFAAANGRATSQDGQVTVTVGPNGALMNLELGHRACDLGPARLTALILETARSAQKVAAAKVVEAFEPLGADTEAMRFVLDSIAAHEEPEDVDEFDPEPEPEPEPQRVPHRPQPVAPQRPVRRAPRDDDEDDDNQPW
ncbi:YbaB/EbfC family nucleoid-associated protein [Saccharothrix sp.]|uniref:YbaB/EbfC family nucleoid-associated protein n=1 Tax=Saccharothrix sp. TaxID=1873460 RepID=UPI002810B089|nr:YbaB/EbfC family nucleoid-associated protein [Saccharothrix sp.]